MLKKQKTYVNIHLTKEKTTNNQKQSTIFRVIGEQEKEEQKMNKKVMLIMGTG